MRRALLALACGALTLLLAGPAQSESGGRVLLPVIAKSAGSLEATPTPRAGLPPLPTAFVPSPTATPRPTQTAQPSATAVPATPTSEPTGTSEPAGTVVVLTNSTTYRTSIGSLAIAGEVRNNSAGPVSFVKIIADFYDRAGNLVATTSTYAATTHLAPGDRTCFREVLSSPPASYERSQLSVTSSVGGNATPKLTVFGVSHKATSSTSRYEIIGQVRNDDTRTARFPKLVATLYTAGAHQVADCAVSFANVDPLPPGQTSSFDILAFGRPDYADVADYRVQAEGSY